MLDNRNIEQYRWLSQSNKELDETKEINEKLTIENRELNLKISNLKRLLNVAYTSSVCPLVCGRRRRIFTIRNLSVYGRTY
ncbi:MAG TPA: hypothetical protein VKA09_17885 [Nitrososphaeraceae archaeon]|nr:hypothetical protein [Nitrososphaeraceae archaeon]